MAPTPALRPVILDGDPGHDDSVNILLAHASPEVQVLGVTTTFGNVGLDRTTHNALTTLALIGASTPVYAGADRPLLVARLSAESVHGQTGLDGPLLPAPTRQAEALHAALFIIREVRARPGQVTLLPTGPLTNVALALRLAPDIAPLIQQIVWMGGSLDVGNWTPAAEFNALCDPHAAQIVFGSGVPVVMFGLNATHQAIATPERIAPIRALSDRPGASAVGEVVAGLLEFFAEHHRERYGWEGGPLHDPLTCAYLIAPELFGTQAMYVEVDTSGGPSSGRTNCDLWNLTGRAPNAEVALNVDSDGFYRLLTERLGRL
ncbi:nucleoside hydrolase [Deinococcus altitudinis]|uniref:nucleoside hydrolase n=1 Tax=Deinococcus altitudinis TaxID=468914 RepID=UPI0038925353